MSTETPTEGGPSTRINRTHYETAKRLKRMRRIREFAKRIGKPRAVYRTPNGELRRRARRRKRKTALIASAAVMGLGTAATDNFSSPSTEMTVPLKDRQAAHKLSASEEIMRAIAEEEGVHLTVYRDPVGKPTVGVGHLVRFSDGLQVGDRISYERAMEFLERDLKSAEASVRRLVGKLPLYQHEFDALVDLVFNVGPGNAGPDKSPRLNEAIAAYDYAAIADELAYYHADNTKLRGLEYRSERRRGIFANANYADPRPAGTRLAGFQPGWQAS